MPKTSPSALFLSFFTSPFQDLLQGLERCLLGTPPESATPGQGYRRLALVGLGLLLGWWIYVPIHELLHAGGCLATGGSVNQLEISTLYGGGILARVVPFVTAGSEYAGRLSGFDTGGCDGVYLATVFAPYLLTLFPGVWLLLLAGRRGQPLLYGFSIPVAFAPFVSIPGDAYEIGSILTTRLPPWSALAETLRGDDVALLVTELSQQPEAPWGGLVLGVILGVLWALMTYAGGRIVARVLDEPPGEASK